VAFGELRRAPAVDRLADELFRADEEPEADEDDDGVLATQPVDVVVVHAKLYLANAQYRLEQLLHTLDAVNSASTSVNTPHRHAVLKLYRLAVRAAATRPNSKPRPDSLGVGSVVTQ